MEFCKPAIVKDRKQSGALKLADHGNQLIKRLNHTSVFSSVESAFLQV